MVFIIISPVPCFIRFIRRRRDVIQVGLSVNFLNLLTVIHLRIMILIEIRVVERSV